MTGRVFISHASEDDKVAAAVCATLEAYGISCWIAPRDILPGHDYAQTLFDAIIECECFVMIFSANANNSPHVRREVEQAWRDGDPIIPFRIDDAVPIGALQFHLGAVNWLASPSDELSRHIALLRDVVKARLSVGSQETADPAEIGQRLAANSQLGAASVLRRMSGRWISILLWSAIALVAIDLVANVDALSGRLYSRSLFGEPDVDVAERVESLSAVQVLLFFPVVPIWLFWLCAAYLTLEAKGVQNLDFDARQVPYQFVLPGLTMVRPVRILSELWRVSCVGLRSRDSIHWRQARAPRIIWAWWALLLGGVGLQFSMAFSLEPAKDFASTESLLLFATSADALWLGAAGSALWFLKGVEKHFERCCNHSP